MAKRRDDRTATPLGASSTALSSALFSVVPLLAGVVAILLPLSHGLPWMWQRTWTGSVGVTLAFRIDGLSMLMLLLIVGIGLAVFIYAGGYLFGDPRRVRLYLLLSLFLGAMVGCVAADDLIVLFLFWEATSLLSFMLVGADHEDEASRKAAQQALLVTGTGGLALLAGILLLGHIAGTYSISGIIEHAAELRGHPLLPYALGLVFFACFTKSAQFPTHFWLPNAMAAPTPVSAYLHSATMVKLGVYLLARLDPAFGELLIWQVVLVSVGSFTSLWAMILALRERDLKRILAWSTVGTLGSLVMLVGIPGEGSAIAVVSLLLAHALYKAPLFFVAGNVDHGTGTRVIDRLGELRKKMPYTALAAALAGMSMAGIPSSFGFFAKSATKAAHVDADTLGVLLLLARTNLVSSAIGTAVAAIAAIRIFWHHPGKNVVPKAHEGGLAMVLPPLLLAALGAVFGLYPASIEPLLEHAVASLTPGPGGPPVSFAVEGTTWVVTFLVILGAGAAVFVLWDRLHAALERFDILDSMGASRLYEIARDAIPKLGAYSTRRLQHGRLPTYLAVMVGATVVLLVALGVALDLTLGENLAQKTGAVDHLVRATERSREVPAFSDLLNLVDLRAFSLDLPTLAGALVVAAGGVLACLPERRIVLLLASGLVGYGSALIFLFAGAPDLAFTQFTVETVFVVVVASLLLELHRRGRDRSLPERRVRWGALLLGSAFAVLITGLLLAVHVTPLPSALSDWFNAHSLTDANGRNVVNVIIVDFRGFDTLGEIAVVLFSFLAALPLFRALRAPSVDGAPGGVP